MSDNKCPTCGAPIGGPSFVRLPRAQHEALMAAAKAIKKSKSPLMDIAYRLARIEEDIRAAGIDLEEKHETW